MSYGTEKILVIEDEPQVLSNLSEILGMDGYQVVTADNGRRGLDLVRAESPDLVISDVMMPELDGYMLVKQLRENAATVHTPVILLTAKAERADMRYGIELGADDYITKPFDIQELLKAVRIRLERKAKLDLEFQQIRQQADSLMTKVEQQRKEGQDNQTLASIKDDLLNKVLRDLSDPISTINLASRMLGEVKSKEQQERYLKILRDECDREIKLLNELSELQTLLTSQNAALLQRFNLLNKT